MPWDGQQLQAFDKYFAMARGTPSAGALDMSKFFDTNYHYMVPELDLDLIKGANADFSYVLEKVSVEAHLRSLNAVCSGFPC